MLRPFLSLIFLLSILWLDHPVSAADDKGWFGMSVSVDAEGISLNPTIRSIAIESVVPSSPAAAAGMVAGDIIVEAENILVAGATASILKAAMQKKVGQALHLKIRSGTAAPRDVTLVAIAKPAQH